MNNHGSDEELIDAYHQELVEEVNNTHNSTREIELGEITQDSVIANRLKQAHQDRLKRKDQDSITHTDNNANSTENSSRMDQIDLEQANNAAAAAPLQSNANLGVRQTINQAIRQGATDRYTAEENMKRRKCDLIWYIISILVVAQFGGQNCGVPIQFWIIVYNCIQIAKLGGATLIEKLDQMHSLDNQIKFKMIVKVMLIISMEITYVSWIIYGNNIYYSDANNCSSSQVFLSYVMLMILIMGYFHLMLYAFGCCLVFAVCYFVRKQNTQQKEGAVKILQNLNKTSFGQISNALFTNSNECSICYLEYQSNDEIVKLKCNENHFFHSECIESWIKSGKNTCPLCRAPIDKNVSL